MTSLAFDKDIFKMKKLCVFAMIVVMLPNIGTAQASGTEPAYEANHDPRNEASMGCRAVSAFVTAVGLYYAGRKFGSEGAAAVGTGAAVAEVGVGALAKKCDAVLLAIDRDRRQQLILKQTLINDWMADCDLGPCARPPVVRTPLSVNDLQWYVGTYAPYRNEWLLSNGYSFSEP